MLCFQWGQSKQPCRKSNGSKCNWHLSESHNVSNVKFFQFSVQNSAFDFEFVFWANCFWHQKRFCSFGHQNQCSITQSVLLCDLQFAVRLQKLTKWNCGSHFRRWVHMPKNHACIFKMCGNMCSLFSLDDFVALVLRSSVRKTKS